MGEDAATLPPDVDAFLRTHSRTFLLATRADGSPTGWPMVGLYGDGVIQFSTYRKSAKVRRVEDDPRVCCLVTAGDVDPDRRAVVIDGRAEVVTAVESPVRGANVGAPGDLHVPDEIAERAADRLRSGKRVMVRVVPERVAMFEAP